MPGLRRELGLRGFRLRAFRGAGDDARVAQAIPSRAGHRDRRVLEDLELGRSPNVRVLWGWSGGSAPLADQHRSFADALSTGERWPRQPSYRGSRGGHSRARRREGAREPVSQVQDGWREGLGFRRRNGSQGHSVASGTARPRAARSRHGHLAPEQSANDRSHHEITGPAHEQDRDDSRKIRQHRRGEYSDHARAGDRERPACTPARASCFAVSVAACLGARLCSTGRFTTSARNLALRADLWVVGARIAPRLVS